MGQKFQLNFFKKILIYTLIFTLLTPPINVHAQNKKTDDDLFPIIITNPQNPTTPNTPTTPNLPTDPGLPGIDPITLPGTDPTLPNLPGISPLPSSGSLFPIGGSSSIFGSTFGTNTMQAAQVPNEFYCPLFESNPYDSIFRAIDAMNQAMKINSDCSPQQSQYNDFYSNSEKIRNLVLQIQQYTQNPEFIANANTNDIERVVYDAVTGVNSIATNLSNNSYFNKNCTSSKPSLANAALAANDILNNLAPVGLVIASLFPAIGTATKIALLGGVYASTAVKGFQNFMDSNTLKMTDPAVSAAILQNTCQYIKIRQKIDFLLLGEEGRLDEIKSAYFTNIEAYRIRYSNPSSQLVPLMQYKYQAEKTVTDIEGRIVDDKYNVNFFQAKIKSAGDDKERICLIGSTMVKNSKDAETFPASVLRVLESALEATKLNGGQVDAQAQTESDEFSIALTKSRNRLGILTAKVIGDDSPETEKAIQLCAEETKTWLKRIADTIIYSENLINKEAKEVEALLSQNADYKVWNAQYKKLKSEKGTMDKVVKVLKEMSKPNAVYIRSELSQRAQQLRDSLFKNEFFFAKSPVLEWLDFNIASFRSSFNSYRNYVDLLQTGALSVKSDNSSSQTTAVAKSSAYQDFLLKNSIKSTPRLENLTLKTLPKNTEAYNEACKLLKDAYRSYKQASDYLGSAQFMCDMIDPYINDTGNDIIALCKGGKTFNSPKKSKVTQLIEGLSKDYFSASLSADKFAELIRAKRAVLKCPIL
ncbi:MAG: hypothetical protein HUU56_01880 [Bdellovibrionaceae bacterium]|nr:hypothetical protein [Pseudobdellovibrionaceae bacterium]